MENVHNKKGKNQILRTTKLSNIFLGLFLNVNLGKIITFF